MLQNFGLKPKLGDNVSTSLVLRIIECEYIQISENIVFYTIAGEIYNKDVIRGMILFNVCIKKTKFKLKKV